MADVFTKEKRSELMSKVRSADTKPELMVRRYLHRHGFRYSLHSSKLPGKPDIVFPSRKVVIFVNGCFWHGHQHCRYFKVPKSNSEFWQNKIASNVARDEKNIKALKEMGYRVIVLWTCQLKSSSIKSLEAVVRKINR